MASHPDAFGSDTQAPAIIQQAVSQIRAIISGITYTSSTQVNPQYGIPMMSYTFYPASQAQKGLGASQVHQDANTICDQGSNTQCHTAKQ